MIFILLMPLHPYNPLRDVMKKIGVFLLALSLQLPTLHAEEIPAPSKLHNHYVGELHQAWQFPSDHLPMGATIDGFHVATWNVLNSAFISWIERNSQGLSKSQIMDEHAILLHESGLTLREEHLVQNIVKMIDHPTHPRSIIALQESGSIFLQELQRRLPKKIKIYYSSSKPVVDQNVILYNSEEFALLEDESRIVTNAYPSNPGRPLMDVVFLRTSTQVKYRIVNTHLPGDPNLPGKLEFAFYLAGHRKQDTVCIALGDMNFDPQAMESAFEASLLRTFRNLVGYRTIVGTDKAAKALDHIYVDFGKNTGEAHPNLPEEVLPGLEAMVALLDHGAS